MCHPNNQLAQRPPMPSIPGLGSGCCGLAAQLEGQFQTRPRVGRVECLEPEILALGVPGIGFGQQTHRWHLAHGAHGVMATRQPHWATGHASHGDHQNMTLGVLEILLSAPGKFKHCCCMILNLPMTLRPTMINIINNYQQCACTVFLEFIGGAFTAFLEFVGTWLK